MGARHAFFFDHFSKHLSSVLGRTELCHDVRNPRPQKPQIIHNENQSLALLERVYTKMSMKYAQELPFCASTGPQCPMKFGMRVLSHTKLQQCSRKCTRKGSVGCSPCFFVLLRIVHRPLNGPFRAAVFHSGGVPENCPLALMGRFPPSMGRLPTLP